jgi:ABC-type polysaccharide/polyol phosphate export permease
MAGGLQMTGIREAFDDIRRGFGRHEFWRTFAVDEIASRYRRSRLGQFWITLSVAIFILVIGGLYRDLLSHSDNSYFAYMAVGYIVWIFISDVVSKSGNVFSANKAFIMQNPMPYSVYCYKLVMSEIYTIAHHAVILPPIFIYLHIYPSISNIILAAIGFLLVVYVAFWVTLILGILSLRFRDLVPITQSIMRMVFFATPIIWHERQLGAFGAFINTINPVRYYIAVVRAPLIGEPVEATVYLVAVILALVLTAMGIALLANTRRKIAYWL